MNYWDDVQRLLTNKGADPVRVARILPYAKRDFGDQPKQDVSATADAVYERLRVPEIGARRNKLGISEMLVLAGFAKTLEDSYDVLSTNAVYVQADIWGRTNITSPTDITFEEWCLLEVEGEEAKFVFDRRNAK